MNSCFEVLWKSAVTHTYWGKIALVTSAKTTMTTAITKKRVVNKDYRHDMTQCRMMKTLMGNLLSIFWGLTGCNEIDPQYPLCDSMEWGLSTLQWQNANSGVCQVLSHWNFGISHITDIACFFKILFHLFAIFCDICLSNFSFFLTCKVWNRPPRQE